VRTIVWYVLDFACVLTRHRDGCHLLNFGRASRLWYWANGPYAAERN
jgi:hypothetical protein